MRRFLLLAVLTVTTVGVLAAPAFAVIEGPCDAYFNGIPFDDLDTPAEAKDTLVVLPGEALNLSGAVYGDVDALRVDIVFRPFTITIVDEYEPDGQAGGAETFDVDVPIEFLARFGSGIYEFRGSTDICTGNAYFILGGVEPWETLIGQVAMGTAGLGGLIGLTSWIPTMFTGRVGWGRDIFGGILIGLGGAIFVQQAGEIPLGAMSAGVGVGAGIGGSVLIDKVCAGINGIFSGGGSAMPPPPTAPPPTPQSFPDTFQGAQPEFTRSADTFQGGGQSGPGPEFTRSADTFQGADPDVVTADPVGAFGGSTPTSPPDVAPDYTRSADTFQGSGQSPSEAELGSPSLPADQVISDTFEVPSDGAGGGSGPGSTSTAPSTPGAGSSSASPAPADAPGPTAPGGHTGSPSPGGITPPDLSAPGGPTTGTPVSGGVTPSDLPAPQAGSPSGGGVPGTPSSTTASPSSTPAGGTPAGAAPSGSGAVPGGGLPMGSIAGVAAPVAMASLAKAAAKQKKGKASAKDAYWFYVEGRTPIFSLEDHTRQVGDLRPGAWYLARATYDEWVHMRDEEADVEGWVPGWAVRRQG